MLLSVKNLSISFETESGTVKAVRNLSFQIDKNQVLGVVGESGCGKSITNLALMGLLPKEAKVTADELKFDGLDLLSLNEKKWSVIRGKKIGMIFQDPMSALNPCFTIRYQLEEAIRYNHIGIPSDQVYPMALDLLSMVGIPDPKTRMDSYPHEMSGGMAQRVMIAMAISGHPKLLIADEPTTALDVTIQLQILKLLKEIQERNNMSIIFVSHDLNVISKISDKVQVMYAGEIIETGMRNKIIHEYRHPYTNGLLHSLPGSQNNSDKLYSIPGIVADLKNRPTGCQFAPRCQQAEADCEIESKILTSNDNGHQWKCINPIERQSSPKC
jgi:dipeptide transport system ATP-binding protein